MPEFFFEILHLNTGLLSWHAFFLTMVWTDGMEQDTHEKPATIDHARAATVPYVPAELMRASFTPRKRMHANAMPMHASRHDQRASSPYVQ